MKRSISSLARETWTSVYLMEEVSSSEEKAVSETHSSGVAYCASVATGGNLWSEVWYQRTQAMARGYMWVSGVMDRSILPKIWQSNAFGPWLCVRVKSAGKSYWRLSKWRHFYGIFAQMHKKCSGKPHSQRLITPTWSVDARNLCWQILDPDWDDSYQTNDVLGHSSKSTSIKLTCYSKVTLCC